MAARHCLMDHEGQDHFIKLPSKLLIERMCQWNYAFVNEITPLSYVTFFFLVLSGLSLRLGMKHSHLLCCNAGCSLCGAAPMSPDNSKQQQAQERRKEQQQPKPRAKSGVRDGEGASRARQVCPLKKNSFLFQTFSWRLLSKSWIYAAVVCFKMQIPRDSRSMKFLELVCINSS